MNKDSKHRVAEAQGWKCICCGLPVINDWSWDHFVPQSKASSKALKIGLGFLAHASCNSKRGDSPPDLDMIARAVDVVSRLGDDLRHPAILNMQLALRDHQQYARTLSDMVTQLKLKEPR